MFTHWINESFTSNYVTVNDIDYKCQNMDEYRLHDAILCHDCMYVKYLWAYIFLKLPVSSISLLYVCDL